MWADRFFAAAGAVLGFLAVAAGAFGAHALRDWLSPALLEVFETAARYQMYHALSLLAVAWVSSRWASPIIRLAGWMFVGGIVLFSGSLYMLALTGIGWFGAITPLGGIALLAGWLGLAWGVLRSASDSGEHR